MSEPGTWSDFRRVYEDHFDFVWRSLRRLGVPEADVSDVAQEVFVVVHRKLHEFEGRSKLTTWLFAICFRQAAQRRRADGRRREVSDDELLEAQPDDAAHPAELAEQHEAARVLESILDRMMLEQRAAFVLFELEGLSCQEIATALDIPLGTAKSRIRLARVAFEEGVARFQARSAVRILERVPS